MRIPALFIAYPEYRWNYERVERAHSLSITLPFPGTRLLFFYRDVNAHALRNSICFARMCTCMCTAASNNFLFQVLLLLIMKGML